jgi:hypothetical protein
MLFVSGCTAADNYLASAPDNFGEANRQTFAAQVIDPEPQYETAVPVSSGQNAANAIERYNKDAVKQPQRESTTSGTGSGSSSSAGA